MHLTIPNYLNLPSKLVFLFWLTFTWCIDWHIEKGMDANWHREIGVNEDKMVIPSLESKSYCEMQNSNYAKNLTCDFQNTNKTIVIEGIPKSVFQEVHISNAKKLVLLPICVPSTYIYNTSYFTTIYNMHNSEECLTSCSVSNSTVDTLSYGIQSVTMNNSTAKTIYLKRQRHFSMMSSHIDHIEWIDCYDIMGILLFNSSVSKISHLYCDNILLMVITSSRIGTIIEGSINLTNQIILINNTLIESIESNGLIFNNEHVYIENTIIENINISGMVVDETSYVALKNVTIIHGVPSSFSFPVEQNIEIENVTINGQTLKYHSKWINKFDAGLKMKLITVGIEECTKKDDVLECNFEQMPYNLYPHLDQRLKNISKVLIRNTKRLAVNNHFCNLKNITIYNSNVTQITGKSKRKTKCFSSLNIVNSSVSIIETNAFNNLLFNNSYVYYMEAANVSKFIFEESIFENVNILNTNEGSEGVIENCHLNIVNRASLNGAFKVVNSTIALIKNLELNHPHLASHIFNSTLSTIDYEGLTLKSGTLNMDQVIFCNLVHESIFIEENASLVINSSYSVPSSGHGFISVVDKSQVMLNVPVDYVDENSFYTLRKSETNLSDFHFVNEITLNGTFAPSPYCFVLLQLHICDLKNYKNVSMSINFSTSGPSSSYLRNINSLTLNPWCKTKIKLENILNGTVPKPTSNVDVCSYLPTLYISNSNIIEIRQRILELTIESSVVNVLEPISYINYVSVRNSSISSVNGVSFMNKFEMEDSNIMTVEEIVAMGNFNIRYSYLSVIKSMGVTVTKGSNHSIITHSIIDLVLEKGVSVFGELYIKNTIINMTNEMAFDVFGKLVLENVEIVNGSLLSFNINEGGLIECANVRINGKIIRIITQIRYIEGDQIDSNYTQMNLTTPENKEQNVEEETISLLNETNEINGTILWPLVPDAKSDSATPGIHLNFSMDIPKMNNSSNGRPIFWPGIILGFFIGIGVSVLTMYGFFLFRPDSKHLLPSFVHWNVRDDHQGLISPIEEEMEERNVPHL